MLLNEVEILRRLCAADPQKRLVITPIIDAREQIQPTSVDLRLGTEFKIIRNARFEYLNILAAEEQAEADLEEYLEEIRLSFDSKFVLHPNEFALACTLEFLRLPPDLAGRLEGKSTWGRVGLQVHSTAGFVDPGFEGALTFELQNVGKVPIPLYPGIRVAQICFYECGATNIGYGQKAFKSYGGTVGVIGSRFYRMPELEKIRGARQEQV